MRNLAAFSAVPEEPPELTIEAVLDYWRSLEILPAAVFAALEAEARASAFSLAEVWDQKFLAAVHESLYDAIAEGMTWKEWADVFDSLIQFYGGKAGAEVYSETPWYSQLVFRQNVLNAYAAGAYAAQFSPKGIDRAPYWMFSAIEDERLCEICAPLDGQVFEKTDETAREFLPSLHFNCRCTAIDLDAEDVAAGNYTVSNGHDVTVPVPDGFNHDKVATLVPESLREVGSR
jgi:SPP1 gp7 family putative phage head morphogenesis protein